MKKYVLLVMASAFMFSMAVSAQDQAPAQGRKGEKKEFKQGERPQLSPEKRAEKMAKELSLTDAQKAQVQALIEKQDAKRVQHLAEIKKIREEQKARFVADRKSMDDELVSIIGKEKFEQLKTKRTEMKEKMGERRERSQQFHQERMGKMGRMNQFNPSEKPMVTAQNRAERMAKVLSLTADQKAQVQALFEKQDANLDKQLAELNKIRKDHLAQMETIHKTQDAEIEKVIGKEKFQTLQTKRSEMMGKMKDGKMENENMPPRAKMGMPNPMQNKMMQLTPDKRAERMAKELTLSETQKASLQEIFVKQDAERVQYMTDQKKFREDQEVKFEALKETQDADLQKIIGPEKFQQLEKYRAENKDKMKMRMGKMNNRMEKMNKWKEKNPTDSTTVSK